MNVRLSVGRLGNIAKGMRTAGWCMVFLGMVAGFTGSAAAAENTEATRTALAVATNNAGPRTRVTLTAHVSADVTGAPSGVVNFRSGEMDLGSAFLDGEGNAALETDNLPAGSHQVVAIYQGGAGLCDLALQHLRMCRPTYRRWQDSPSQPLPPRFRPRWAALSRAW